jgi:MoaA/NifB/PqqE/SkfB family radical SAM enzyme
LTSGKLRGYASWSSLVNAKDFVQKKIIADIYKTGRMPVRCSAGRETAVIYPDGSIPGCELREEILGNLGEVGFDFGKIWFGEKANQFITKIRDEGCTCYHQCFLSASMIKSPRLWPDYAQAIINQQWGNNY